MNDKIFQLILKILDSRLSPQTQEEIVKFFLLPRNTPVRPIIELPEDDKDLGTVARPDAHDEQRKLNPKLAESEDAVKDTLKGRI